MRKLEQASIVIVSYNNQDDILSCLDAIYQHTHIPFEIIVFDNASTDKTTTLVTENFPQVCLIAHESNIGFAQGNNKATEHASSDVFVFLNPDTIVQENWLAPLVEVLNKGGLDLIPHPNLPPLRGKGSTPSQFQGEGWGKGDRVPQIGAVTSQILFAESPNRINACGNNVYLSGMTYCQFLGEVAVAKTKPFPVGAVSGAAFGMKRPLFEQLGGFEESFFMYYEDTDLSLRLNYLGWQCAVVPTSVVWHNYHATFHANKVYYLERNRYLSILSLLHWGLLVLMFPAILWSEIVTWGYCLLQGQGALQAKVRSWRDVWRQAKWIRSRRKHFAKWQPSKQLLKTVFVNQLDAGYAAENQLLGRVVASVSWILAAPILAISRLGNKEFNG